MPLAALLLAAWALSGCGRAAADGARPEVGHLASIPIASLERPIALRDDLGARAATTATNVSIAERYRAQGQAYLDGFAWLHAARSFHAALRAAPAPAVARAARIGLFHAYLGLESPARAADALARADGGEEKGPEDPADADGLERSRLARLQRDAVLAGAPGGAAHGAYLRALEARLARHPEDFRAAILRGHAGRRPDGWGQAGGAEAVPWYRHALALAPDHPAPHHFLAHAYEHQGRHAEALEHASRFAALAPGIPHAHHMVAHAAPGIGRWDAARAALERADRLHRAEIAAGTVTPAEDWHFGHNLRLLGAVLHRLDARPEASAAFREAFELGYGGRRAGFYCVPHLVDLLLAERFERARQAADDCAARGTVMARLVGAAMRGEALLGLGDAGGAAAARAEAARRLEDLLADRRPASSEAAFVFLARRAIDVLDAKLALRAPGAGAAQAGRLLDLADALCAGRSVDAWAICRPRVEELARFADRVGHAATADALRARLNR